MEIDKLFKLLSTINIPVKYGWFDENIKENHLTFFLMNENPKIYDDDDFDSIESIYQFDLWIKEGNPYTNYPAIKKILIDNGFKYITLQGFNEKENNIYHLAFRYSYLDANLD